MEIPADYLEQRTRTFLGGVESATWEKLLDLVRQKLPGIDLSRALFIKIENGLGDQVCVLGLMSGWKQYYKATTVIGIAKKSSADLISLYEGALDLVFDFDNDPPFPVFDGKSLFNVMHRPSKAHIKNGTMNPWFFRYGISYLDQYRIGLELPPGSPFNFPKLAQKHKLLSTKDVDQYRDSIILFPFSNTNPTESTQFYSNLAKELANRGFKVFTNIVNKINNQGLISTSSRSIHEALEHTLPLNASLIELLQIADVAKMTVSGLSGPPFFLANASCLKAILHKRMVIPTHYWSSGDDTVNLIDIDRVTKSFPYSNSIIDVEVSIKETDTIENLLNIIS